MMNSDDVQAGTVTKEELLSTGWEEDDEEDPAIPESYHESLGKADGLLNMGNGFSRSWYHSNMWTGDDGRVREVCGRTLC